MYCSKIDELQLKPLVKKHRTACQPNHQRIRCLSAGWPQYVETISAMPIQTSSDSLPLFGSVSGVFLVPTHRGWGSKNGHKRIEGIDPKMVKYLINDPILYPSNS